MINNNIELQHRYVSHIEDDPMVWQKTCDILNEILAETESMVVHRNKVNGAGEGLVIDMLDDRIVACFGMTMPDTEKEEKRVIGVVKRWLRGDVTSIEPEGAHQHILTVPSGSPITEILTSQGTITS